MILLTDRIESTKVPNSELIKYRSDIPLSNPCRWAYWDMEKHAIRERREVIEVSTWEDYESLSQVVAVRSRGLEKWD